MKAALTTENSIPALFDLLKIYEEATNAKINKGKTEALWLGKWREKQNRPLNLNWINSEVKFLGIYIGNDREMASLRTFNEILEKIKQKISYWNTKSISIKGKIKILNTFVLSKLWYALECHDIPNEIHVDLKNLISTFIWKGYHQQNYNKKSE